jgi:HEAT repeat protein
VLVDTLVEWKRQGHKNILVTWGGTSGRSRREVKALLAAAGVDYTTPEPPQPVSRTKLVLSALSVLAVAFVIGYRLYRVVLDSAEQTKEINEAQRLRLEKGPEEVRRGLAELRTRTFKKLEDPDPETRTEAVILIGRAYPNDEQTVPALVKTLDDDDATVRFAAVIALGNLGTKTEAVTDALRKRLSDENEEVRKAAKEALEKTKQ